LQKVVDPSVPSFQSLVDNKVVLIDGAMLSRLMLDLDLGVSTIANYAVKRIDSDYFEEEIRGSTRSVSASRRPARWLTGSRRWSGKILEKRNQGFSRTLQYPGRRFWCATAMITIRSVSTT
jgi:hypothetical protein